MNINSVGVLKVPKSPKQKNFLKKYRISARFGIIFENDKHWKLVEIPLKWKVDIYKPNLRLDLAFSSE